MSTLHRPVALEKKQPKRWVIILGAIGVVVGGVFATRWAVNKLSES